MAKQNARLAGHTSRRIEAGNLALSLGTTNPTLSIPYVKYYTSILEEYQKLNDTGSSANAAALNLQNRDPKRYAFPSYLRFKPYIQANEFPAIQTYQPDSSFVKVFNEKQSTIVLKNDEDVIKKVPYTKTAGNSDIILTYRSTKSRGSTAKLGKGIENKIGATISDAYEMATEVLTKHALRNQVIDGAVGNTSSSDSYLKQFIHAALIHRTKIEDSKLAKIDKSKITKLEAYTLPQQRLIYLVDTLIYNINHVIGNIRNTLAQAVFEAGEAKTFLQNVTQILGDLKIDFLNGKVKPKILDMHDPKKAARKFKSYLQLHAMILVGLLHTIHKITNLYIDLSRTRIVNISGDLRVKNTTILHVAKCLAFSLRLQSDELPKRLSAVDWTSASAKTDNINLYTIENSFRPKINAILKRQTKKRGSKSDYDYIFKVRYPSINSIYQYIIDMHLMWDNTGKDYLQEISDTIKPTIDGITELTRKDYIEQSTSFPDLRNHHNSGVQPTFSQDIYVKTDQSLLPAVKAVVKTKWVELSDNTEFSNGHPTNITKLINESTSGVLGISTLIKNVYGLSNIIKHRHLVIRNKETSTSHTTVTKFDISMMNSNIPIYMDGHDGPIVQNFNGPTVQITLSIVTNDVFLLDNICAAAQELDIAYRTRSEVNNTSPLGSTFAILSSELQTNSIVYQATRKSALKRLRSLINKENTSMGSSNVDAPIIITNNVANMSGVYGVVVNEIQVNTVEGFPNLFQIDLSMTSVDINQASREVPRKVKSEIPPDLTIASLCRLNLYSCYNGLDKVTEAARTSAIFHSNNIQFAVNRNMAKLAYMYWMTQVLSSERGISSAGISPLISSKDGLYRISTEILFKFVREFLGGEILPIISSLPPGANLSAITKDIKAKYERLFQDFIDVLGETKLDIKVEEVDYTYDTDKQRRTKITVPISRSLSILEFYQTYGNKEDAANVATVEIAGRKIPLEVASIDINDDKFANELARWYKDEEYAMRASKYYKYNEKDKQVANPLQIIMKSALRVNIQELKGIGSHAFDMLYSSHKSEYASVPSDTLYSMYLEFATIMGFVPKENKGTGNIAFEEMLQLAKRDKSNLDIMADMTPGMIVQAAKELRKTHVINKTFGKHFYKAKNIHITPKLNGKSDDYILHLLSVHDWDKKINVLQDLRIAYYMSQPGSTPPISIKYYANGKETDVIQLEPVRDKMDIHLPEFRKYSKDPFDPYSKTDHTELKILGENSATSIFGEFTYNAIIEAYLAAAENVSLVNASNMKTTKIKAVERLFKSIDFSNSGDLKYKTMYIHPKYKLKGRVYNSDITTLDVTMSKALGTSAPVLKTPTVVPGTPVINQQLTFKNAKIQGKYANYTGPVLFGGETPEKLKLYYRDKTRQTMLMGLYEAVIPEMDVEDVESVTGALINPVKRVSLRISNLIAYRLMDSLSMRLVVPLVAFMTRDTDYMTTFSYKNDQIKYSEGYKIIGLLTEKWGPPKTKIGDELKAIPSTKLEDAYQLGDSLVSSADIFKRGMGFLVSPGLVIYMTHVLSSPSTEAYDVYNAYPDRPLPVVHKTRGRGINNRILSTLHMHVTPDFYIKKDTTYMEMVISALEDNISLARGVIEQETVNQSDRVEGLRESQKRRLKVAGQMALEQGADVKIGIRNYVESSLASLTGANTSKSLIKRHVLYQLRSRHPNVREAADDAGQLYSFLATATQKLTGEVLTKPDDLKKAVFELLQLYPNKVKNEESRSTAQVIGVQRILKEMASMIGRNETALYNTKTLVEDAARLARPGSYVSSRDLATIKSILNPSAAAYGTGGLNVMQTKMQMLKSKMQKVSPASTLTYALPTFKFYIIEEDAKEFLFFNDFYDYGAVKSIKIHESRKDASSTAHIVLSNMYGKLTNVISGLRSNVERPFAVHPSDEEEVSSMMLREGARIQVRLGYSGRLDVDTVAFSGRIQQIQGTSEIVIVAQSDGVELTRVVGVGPGIDFDGLMSRIKIPFGRQLGNHNSINALGLVTAILDSANTPLRGLGTRIPYMGASRIRNVTDKYIPGVTTSLTQRGYLGTLENYIKKKVTQHVIGFQPSLIDTRLTNINLSSEIGANGSWTTLWGRSRWLLHNETIWDALQDYMLQLGDKICVVRPFDEDGTIIIDNEDGVYQRSAENFMNSTTVYNIIKDLEEGERNAAHAIVIIGQIIEQAKEEPTRRKLDLVVSSIRNALIDAAASLPQKDALFGGKEKLTHPAEQSKVVMENLSSTVDIALELLGASGVNAASKIKRMTRKGSIADLYDNASEYALSEIRNGIEGNKKLNEVFTGTPERLLTRAGRRKDPKLSIMAQYLIVFSARTICKIFKNQIGNSTKYLRPVSDIHLKTSKKDIVKNNMKVVSGYNAVEMGFMDEDVAGSFLQVMMLDKLGSIFGLGRSISIDNINKPSAYTKLHVQASPFLDNDKIMKYGTEQKNAAIRGSIMIDNPLITANSILANLARDYYDGELILLMDASIHTHDVIFVHDDVNDMWGLIKVKEVTHSFSPETGAVTIVKPDLYVRNNMTGLRSTYSTSDRPFWIRVGASAMSTVLFAASIALGAGLGKFLAKSATTLVSGIFKKTGPVMASTGLKRVLTGAGKKMSKKGSKVPEILKKIFGKKAMGKLAKQARALNKTFATKADDVILLSGGKRVRTVPLSKLVKVDQLDDAAQLTIKSIQDMTKNLSKSGDALEKHLGKNLELALSRVLKNAKPKAGKVSVGIDEVLSQLAKRNSMSDAALQKFSSSIDDVMGLVSTNLFQGEQAILGKIPSLMGTLRNTLIDDAFNLRKNLVGILQPLSLRAMQSVIILGLSNKIGSAVIPKFSSFSTAIGSYLNQQPITVGGMIHKGEPMIGNLDGMRRGQIAGPGAFLQYKIGETINPLRDLMGDLQDTMYTVGQDAQDIIGP